MRRISVGGTLARVAMHAFIQSARQISQDGKFDSFAGVVSNAELNKFFHDDLAAPAEIVSEPAHPATGQPIGAPVDDRPAKRPGAGDARGPLWPRRKAHPEPRRDVVGGSQRPRRDLDLHVAVRAVRGRAEFAAWLAQRAALDDPYAYAIVDPSNRTLGIATLMEIQPDMRVIEVGHIVYSPALQRTPLGTEAQYLLARYAFETLGYRRYEWKCNSHNAASRRAALRYGFIFEGMLRQHMIAKGRNRDTA